MSRSLSGTVRLLRLQNELREAVWSSGQSLRGVLQLSSAIHGVRPLPRSLFLRLDNEGVGCNDPSGIPQSNIVKASYKPQATKVSLVLGHWAPRGGRRPPPPLSGALSSCGTGGSLALRSLVSVASAGYSHPLTALKRCIQAALKINYTCYFIASA